MRRCGFLMVVSVLIFTTLGSSCLAMVANAFDICRGDGTYKALASAEVLLLSCPRTPKDTNVPIKIPTARVTRMVKA